MNPDLTPKKTINVPISRLPGRNSKIASMTRNLVPWGPTMQNLRSIACTVWAVGGGGSKMLLRILYLEETCNDRSDGQTTQSRKLWFAAKWGSLLDNYYLHH